MSFFTRIPFYVVVLFVLLEAVAVACIAVYGGDAWLFAVAAAVFCGALAVAELEPAKGGE